MRDLTMPECGYCGTDLSPSAKFCPKCGDDTVARKDGESASKFWYLLGGIGAGGIGILMLSEGSLIGLALLALGAFLIYARFFADLGDDDTPLDDDDRFI